MLRLPKFATILESRALCPRYIKLLVKLATSSKKTLKASEQEREDIAKSRDEWREFQKTVDARRLIFLDEAGLKTNMRACMAVPVAEADVWIPPPVGIGRQ